MAVESIPYVRAKPSAQVTDLSQGPGLSFLEITTSLCPLDIWKLTPTMEGDERSNILWEHFLSLSLKSCHFLSITYRYSFKCNMKLLMEQFSDYCVVNSIHESMS